MALLYKMLCVNIWHATNGTAKVCQFQHLCDFPVDTLAAFCASIASVHSPPMKKESLPNLPVFMRRQKQAERINELARGCSEYGTDFFMVDPRPLCARSKAAPFHIDTQEDRVLFVEQASPFVDWKACENAVSVDTSYKALEGDDNE